MQENESLVLPRLRTVDQCYQFIKEQDPETGMSKNAIRKMANNRQVATVKCGRRLLINLDALLLVLQKPSTVKDELAGEDEPEKIRKLIL